MKKLIALGKDVDGNTHEFTIEDGHLNCWSERLIELTIPEGVIYVSCWDNQLTELILPKGVECIWCYSNQIKELILPEGVEKAFCYDNQIEHLRLPDSVKILWFDKEVKGLERHVGKVTMRLR